MTIDATLEALLHDAAPAVQDAMRSALRRAYDVGYREALATLPVERQPLTEPAPTNAPIFVNPTDDDDDDLEPEDAPPSAVGRALEAADDEAEDGAPTRAVDWGTAEAEAEPAVTADSDAKLQRPIFPHATIGTLRRRIVTAFDLERFDIDVVICRKGDAKRRQLKQTVKLSRYVVEA